jgi:hypothetical protein
MVDSGSVGKRTSSEISRGRSRDRDKKWIAIGEIGKNEVSVNRGACGPKGSRGDAVP